MNSAAPLQDASGCAHVGRKVNGHWGVCCACIGARQLACIVIICKNDQQHNVHAKKLFGGTVTRVVAMVVPRGLWPAMPRGLGLLFCICHGGVSYERGNAWQ